MNLALKCWLLPTLQNMSNFLLNDKIIFLSLQLYFVFVRICLAYKCVTPFFLKPWKCGPNLFDGTSNPTPLRQHDIWKALCCRDWYHELKVRIKVVGSLFSWKFHELGTKTIFCLISFYCSADGGATKVVQALWKECLLGCCIQYSVLYPRNITKIGIDSKRLTIVLKNSCMIRSC